MSFILTKSVTVTKQSSELCNAFLPSSSESVEVTYEVLGLESLSNRVGTIQYSVTPTGGISGYGMFDFNYSGDGNPLDEAEEQLKASL